MLMYQNVTKGNFKIYIEFILWPIKMFTLLPVENPLFFGKKHTVWKIY